MSKYKKNKILIGNVIGIENYGVFIGLNDYYNGLIHISEISNGYVSDINDYVKIGDTIKVKVIEEDEKLGRLKLSIKDIDYRMNKKTSSVIKETPYGFYTLEHKLPEWIHDKLNKTEKN
ncbi:MAG: S1 RNA-binding domain-containing protein [Bacilli bacterium]